MAPRTAAHRMSLYFATSFSMHKMPPCVAQPGLGAGEAEDHWEGGTLLTPSICKKSLPTREGPQKGEIPPEVTQAKKAAGGTTQMITEKFANRNETVARMPKSSGLHSSFFKYRIKQAT